MTTDLRIAIEAFRAWIVDHVPNDPEAVVEMVANVCAEPGGPRGAAAAVLAVSVWSGLRDPRVFHLLIRELPHRPIHMSAALALYGDPTAIPYLEALIDRHPADSPDNAAEVRALARAVVELGGALTATRGAKLITTSVASARASFAALIDEEVTRLLAEPSLWEREFAGPLERFTTPQS